MTGSLNSKSSFSADDRNQRAVTLYLRAAIYCVAALVLVIIGAAIAAATGHLTRPVTHWLGTQLGRELEADAGLRIYFGRVTKIRAAQVRLANTTWATRKDMLLARDIEIDIDTVSLLRDTVIVHRLVVAGLDLRLERNAEGLTNWAFKTHGPRRPGVVPFVIEYAALPAAHLQFIGPQLQQPLDVVFESFEQHSLADGMLGLAARGQANGTSLDLRTQVGPLANLIAGRDFKVRADGHLGEIALGVSGQVDSVSNPVNTQLAVELKAPDADYLTTHIGLHSLGAGPVALNATVRPATSGTGVQAAVLGQIGAFQVTAQGSLLAHQGSREMAIEGQVTGPDLSRMGAFVGLNRLPVEPFQLKLSIQRAGQGLVIKQAELAIANGLLSASGTIGPGGKLADSDLNFGAEIPDIAKVRDPWGLSKVLKGRFSGTVHLSHPLPGEARVQLDATANLGKLGLLGTLGAAPDLSGTKLAFTLSGDDFAPLGRLLRIRVAPGGAYRATGNAEWRHAGLQLRNAVLTVASESLQVDGNVGRRLFAPGSDVNFVLQGASAARLAGYFGLSDWPASKYRIGGHIQRVKGSILLRNVTATVAGASLQLDGALGDSPGLLGTSVAFKVSGSAFENFADLLSVPDLSHGAFAASGQLSVVSGELQLSKAQVKLTDAQSTLSAEIGLPLDRATMRFDFDAKVPDLGRLLPRVGGSSALGKNLTVSAAGARDGQRWTLQRLNLATDSGLLKTQGELVLAPHFAAKSVPFELRTASLRKLGLLSGREWPDEPLELRAKLTQSSEDVVLEDMAGKLGGSTFAGLVAAHGKNRKPDYDLDVAFDRLDLDPYFGKPGASPEPTPTTANGKATDQRLVIPGRELQFPDLNAISGKLSLRARVVRMRGQDFRDLEVLATLRNGRLHVDPLAMTSAAGQLSARFDVTAMNKAVTAQLSATAKNLRFALYPFGFGDANSGLYSAQLDLQGSGESWHELAATLNGRVRLVGNGGRIPNSRLIGSNGFMKQLIVSLDPMTARQPTTEVVCTAYLLKAKDGVVTTDPALVVRTADVDIISNGSADLRTEKIDLSFKIGARKGLGIGVVQVINPYIKVTGTLAKPGVTLDPTGALVNGGAAFATAGLSIVATTLWDRVVHEKDPCGAAIAESDKRARD